MLRGIPVTRTGAARLSLRRYPVSFFLSGGFPMVFVLVFGLVAIAASTRFALQPAEGRVGALVAYASSVILVLTGQFAWAFAMERRGRGDLARRSPRQAGLDGWTELGDQDTAVNEASD